MHTIDNRFLEWLGVRLTAWSPDYAEMALDTASNLGNRTGRVQGGVICTLLDAVAGYSGLFSEAGDALQSLTLSLTTNFIASGEGKTLVAKGFVERKGRGIYFSRGEVWVDSTRMIATGIGTFKYIR